MRTLPLAFVVGALLLSWGGAPARAQLSAEPDSLRIVLVQGEEATAAVTLANTGAAAVPFCLDFDRPLQRPAGNSLGVGCGPPGELLYTFDTLDLGRGWAPYGLTMTSDGRLFVAEWAGGIRETYELTPDLTFVRRFPHPVVAQLSAFPLTSGVTYRPDTGTLWWTNAEDSGSTLHRVMLLEGTLDGAATGRRIMLPIPPLGPPPTNSGYPNGAAYDPASGRFYYVDAQNNTVWAIDTSGVVPPGYPVTLQAYPGTHYVGNMLETYGGALGGPEGVRLELPVGFVLDNIFDRVAVTDPEGRDLGVAETPLAAVLALNNGTADVLGAARSRLDPNGVLYVTYWTPGEDGVAAVRPVPLAPSWLALSAWMGDIPGGGSAEVSLTFSAGNRAPREYRSTLVVEDTTGAVLASVPLVLVVEAGTPAEPGPGTAGSRLSVSPNPMRGAATVTLTLPAPARVRLALYDVLGREVARLHDGPLGAGAHPFPVDGARLPAGVYTLRATGGARASRRLTLLR